MDEHPKIKSIVWMGSSRRDLKAFPAEVRDVIGKRSKKGIATPKTDVDLIKKRLSLAEEDYKARLGRRGRDK